MKSVLALATINALATVPAMCTEADPVSLLDLRESDVVGMAGYFRPIVGQIRTRVRELRVFERTTQRDHDLMPDWAAPALLPECDVAIVTATAIMNRTLDVLLNGTARAREVLILGPSTPLLPVVFANRGVTLLSGINVRDPALLLRIVSEGGGTRQFGAAVRKLTVRIRESRATSAGACKLYQSGRPRESLSLTLLPFFFSSWAMNRSPSAALTVNPLTPMVSPSLTVMPLSIRNPDGASLTSMVPEA
jgi:hypothetical protein